MPPVTCSHLTMPATPSMSEITITRIRSTASFLVGSVAPDEGELQMLHRGRAEGFAVDLHVGEVRGGEEAGVDVHDGLVGGEGPGGQDQAVARPVDLHDDGVLAGREWDVVEAQPLELRPRPHAE